MSFMDFCYIDPSTGSLAFQVLIGGVFGAAYCFRRFISGIVSRLTGRRPPKSGPGTDG